MTTDNETLEPYITQILRDAPHRLVLSGGEDGSRETLRRWDGGYQTERVVNRQAFQKNLTADELAGYLTERLEQKIYRQLNAWSDCHEFNLRLAKRGRPLFSRRTCQKSVPSQETLGHNRKKNYLIPEGTVVPPLVDMGVLTPDGSVVPSRYDKYRQINRFLEMMDDVIGQFSPDKSLHLVDFGCGKSYLTFIVYYYLTVMKGLKTQVTGVDLKREVMEHCQTAAEKYGYEGLHFVTGDIAGFQPTEAVDMVLSLHACNTATDFALFNAVSWDASYVFSVPCCQHELNDQMKADHFSLLTRYGIIQERFAAMATDAIRANLLTACGYQTQLLEFVDLSHTPKNLLIRAVRSDISMARRREALEEVMEMVREYHFQPTLLELLRTRLSVQFEGWKR